MNDATGGTTTQTDGKSTSLKRKLMKPITAHGQTYSELTFREPTAEDIERVGLPCTIKVGVEEFEIKHDAKAWLAMMSNLATVPPSSIRQLDPRDYSSIIWLLQGYFLPTFQE
jgi:Phage tail assembly chaperone proteins, E, or 41 or 14